jgi:uncharacterized protein YggE
MKVIHPENKQPLSHYKRYILMKIKTILFYLLAALLLVGCATGNPGTTISPTISVTGSGDASAKPDIVDIQFGVEAVSSDPAEAVSQNSGQMNAVMDVLHSLKIADADIQTVNYSMWVEVIYDTNGQPTGEQRYHVSNQVNVRLHDLTQTGALLEKVIGAGVNNVAGITFGVADTTGLAQTAMDAALANARQKAERMAEDLGLHLGNVQSVVESGTATPPVPYAGARASVEAAAVPISEGQFSLNVQVQVVFEITQ